MEYFNKYIKNIIELLDKFNPETDSPEQVLEQMCDILQQTVSIEDETFIMEVLSGCLEYKKLLEVVVTAFYAHAGKKFLWCDYNLFIVICYLSTFCLDKIGLQGFSKIIKSLDSGKMYKFLQFFFNVINLSTWIKDEWSLIYDSTYVKETWIEPLLKSSTASTGPPAAFETIKDIQKDVPKVLNVKASAALLLEANLEPYKCAIIKQDKKERELKPLPEYRFKAAARTRAKVPLVFYEPDNIPVRLNAAALYREEALYQQKAEKELQRVEDLLQGYKGYSEFVERQKKIQEKELEERLAKSEYHRLQGKLCREEAIIQHQNLAKENNKKANKKKELDAGHRLFGEMSFVELQERLLLLKEHQKRDEEDKRDQIIREKQAKKNDLMERAEKIAMCREACGRAEALKFEEKKKLDFHTAKAAIKDERNLELKRKIQEIIEERQKEGDLLKARFQKAKKESAAWRRTKTPFEERHWRLLERGQERLYRKLQKETVPRAAEQRDMFRVSTLSGALPCILRSQNAT
ncbi:cilia- and flagella-associated protein 99 [Gracilinanus agilis]|uniref:cilia- and flagella-associated protein 99 n=1 Tax=Gracilinanus agilis TaxID=191870 RepID=UPI001CFD105C|nr:cilia- and flagella-associated protein 99 [Gracilinanus agilis]